MGKESFEKPKTKEERIEEEKSLDYFKTESLDSSELLKENFLHESIVTLGRLKSDMGTRETREALKDLNQAFLHHYTNELGLRFGEKVGEICQYLHHVNWFHHILWKAESGNWTDEHYPLDSTYLEIYKELEKDVKKSFQIRDEVKKSSSHDPSRLYESRKEIAEKYIELVSAKKPEIFNEYIQWLNKSKSEEIPKEFVSILNMKLEQLKELEELEKEKE